MFLFKGNSFILTGAGAALLKKKTLNTVNLPEQGSSLQNKQGEQDEQYYRSLGKLAYKNMALGGGSIYLCVQKCNYLY